ncbi:MAG: hypothetical protein E6Q88_14925 [Lysobacteraceae bacterium]|nr:MAG: hypothetical protein E6Q88_14925 [Xanthomonadaceae bacterium]
MQMIDVHETLSSEDFLAQYVRPNRPVVVGGLGFDPAYWTPENFRRDMGELPALIYDTLFDLQEVTTLGEYIDRHFGVGGELRRGVPYVRWYNRLKDVDHAWGDEAFSRLSTHWTAPPFLPQGGFLVPDAPTADPVRDPFPYRGVLISARGARTRLHRDPFYSDAVVSQFYGSKEVAMYHPSRAAELTVRAQDGTSFGGFMDVRTAALDRVDVEPDIHGVLRPGQVLYVPHGWLHDVISIEDSISVTWNFVHEQGGVEFIDYLMGGAEDDTEFEVLKYLYRRYGGEYNSPQDVVRRFDERFSEILDAYGDMAESAH